MDTAIRNLLPGSKLMRLRLKLELKEIPMVCGRTKFTIPILTVKVNGSVFDIGDYTLLLKLLRRQQKCTGLILHTSMLLKRSLKTAYRFSFTFIFVCQMALQCIKILVMPELIVGLKNRCTLLFKWLHKFCHMLEITIAIKKGAKLGLILLYYTSYNTYVWKIKKYMLRGL